MADKNYSVLLKLSGYLLAYKGTLVAAGIALVFTAVITLSMGQGVRILIDDGFIAGSRQQLNNAALLIIAIAFLMAIGTYVRFYLVSWLGERISADIRAAVFNHLVGLHPSYFEANGSGEIMSRLTTDTTLLQTVIGSSASMALRSALTFSGGLIMLLVTNLKLSGLVLACVPAGTATDSDVRTESPQIVTQEPGQYCRRRQLRRRDYPTDQDCAELHARRQ